VPIEVEGFTVVDFPSGAEFLRRARPIGQCCLLLDLQMPGISGLELLERLRGDKSPIPVVVMTGYPNLALQGLWLALGRRSWRSPLADGTSSTRLKRADAAVRHFDRNTSISHMRPAKRSL